MRVHHTLCMLAIAACAAAGHAQVTTGGKIRAAPQPSATAATTGGTVPAGANRALPAAPSTNGLPTPFNPSLSLPGATGTSAADPGVPGSSAPGVTGPSQIGSGLEDTYPNTTVMGAGAYGTRGLVRPPMRSFSNVDIARSFLGADANRDGELTRVEAMRLTISPLSFEEMDADHNDILTRSEYENALL